MPPFCPCMKPAGLRCDGRGQSDFPGRRQGGATIEEVGTMIDCIERFFIPQNQRSRNAFQALIGSGCGISRAKRRERTLPQPVQSAKIRPAQRIRKSCGRGEKNAEGFRRLGGSSKRPWAVGRVLPCTASQNEADRLLSPADRSSLGSSKEPRVTLRAPLPVNSEGKIGSFCVFPGLSR